MNMNFKLTIIIVFSITILQVLSFPGMKPSKKNSTNVNEDDMDTAMVHTNCCPHRNNETDSLRPQKIQFAQQFIMSWNFFYIYDCKYPECTKEPPYENDFPPFDNSTMEISRGYTYMDAFHRGGSQKEHYLDECIKVFPFVPRSQKWECEFINIMEEGAGYLISKKNKPDWFPECCIMGRPFKPPTIDFTEKMNFAGNYTYPGTSKIYHKFEVINEAGPFSYNFWEGRSEYKNEFYNIPSTFNMLGLGESMEPLELIWMNQVFYNHQTIKPDLSVWDIPQSCRVENIKNCMTLTPEVKSTSKKLEFLK